MVQITYASTTRYHTLLYMLGVAWQTGYEALYRSVLKQL